MATTFRNKKNHPLGVGTLNTAIDDNDLTIVLDAGQGASFPSATFTISIDEEIILIDSRSTDTLTVNASGRGYDSSTASAHAAGVAIANNQIVKDFTDCETAINGIENGTTTLAKVITSGTAENSHTISDAGTNDVVTALALSHITSGTPAAGLGVKQVLRAEDSAGNAQDIAEIQAWLSTVTNASEVGVLLLRLISAGSLADILKFTTPLACEIGTPDGDVIATIGRAKLGALAADGMWLGHYDQFTTSNCAFRQTNAGVAIVNSAGGATGLLRQAGTDSVQWLSGRMTGGPALGTVNVRFSGVLNTITTTVGNITTGVDNLMSYTVPAAQLPTNEDTLNFEMVFKTAANANNKQIKVLYGATTLYDSGVVAANDDQLVVRGRIVRTGAATQIAHITAIGNAGGAFTDTVTLTTPTETLSGTVVLKATGEATSTDDIQQIYMTVLWEPAA